MFYSVLTGRRTYENRRNSMRRRAHIVAADIYLARTGKETAEIKLKTARIEAATREAREREARRRELAEHRTREREAMIREDRRRDDERPDPTLLVNEMLDQGERAQRNRSPSPIDSETSAERAQQTHRRPNRPCQRCQYCRNCASCGTASRVSACRDCDTCRDCPRCSPDVNAGPAHRIPPVNAESDRDSDTDRDEEEAEPLARVRHGSRPTPYARRRSHEHLDQSDRPARPAPEEEPRDERRGMLSSLGDMVRGISTRVSKSRI